MSVKVSIFLIHLRIIFLSFSTIFPQEFPPSTAPAVAALEAAQQLCPSAAAQAQLVLRALREVLGAEGLVDLGPREYH